jgi:hypothetical protein
MTTDQTGGRCARGTRKSRKTGQCEPYVKPTGATKKRQPKELPYGSKIRFKRKLEEIVDRIEKETMMFYEIIYRGSRSLASSPSLGSPYDRYSVNEYQFDRAKLYKTELRNKRNKPGYVELLAQICKGTVTHPPDQMGADKDIVPLEKQVPKFAYNYYDYEELLYVLSTALNTQIRLYPKIKKEVKVILDNFNPNLKERDILVNE